MALIVKISGNFPGLRVFSLTEAKCKEWMFYASCSRGVQKTVNHGQIPHTVPLSAVEQGGTNQTQAMGLDRKIGLKTAKVQMRSFSGQGLVQSECLYHFKIHMLKF